MKKLNIEESILMIHNERCEELIFYEGVNPNENIISFEKNDYLVEFTEEEFKNYAKEFGMTFHQDKNGEFFDHLAAVSQRCKTKKELFLLAIDYIVKSIHQSN